MAKDLFSNQAVDYAKYRPAYPPELFKYIISFVKEKNTAWDCATGNGQAAIALANVFTKIIATDISAQQLQQAPANEKISYSVADAEQTAIAGNSIDLITVAQAYHWFTFDAFYKEVMRVARKEAIIAVWCYSLVKCNIEKVDGLINHFYTNVVGMYWDAERKWVDENYRTIPFPYKEHPPKEFSIAVQWTKDEFIGYLQTWSAVQHYKKEKQSDPVAWMTGELQKIWPGQNSLSFHFPLYLRLGHITK